MKQRLILGLKGNAELKQVLEQASSSCNQLLITRLYDLKDLLKEQADLQSIKLEELGKEEVQSIEKQIIANLPKEEQKIYQTYTVEVNEETNIHTIQKELESITEYIDYVEIDKLNYSMEKEISKETETIPLHNTFLNESLYGLKLIECEQAWEISQGEEIVIAVIDTGVDYKHPDIKPNMWRDQNGHHGYNFVDNSNDPMDDHGHGTHVAGTIAAIMDRALIGVAPKSKIMAIKGLGKSGGYASVLARCLKYAADKKANIINNSWGEGSSRTIENAINYAHSKGSVIVFAAGNASKEVTIDMAAGKPNTIAVSAVNRRDIKTGFSNYGELVDVSAPGLEILSLKHNSSGYTKMSGTSMACPHVAGLIALMLSLNPKLNFAEIKNILIKSIDPHSSNDGKFFGVGRINAKKAVLFVQNGVNPSPSERKKIIGFTARHNENNKTYTVLLELEDNIDATALSFHKIGELEQFINLVNAHDCFIDEDGTITFVSS